MAKAIPADSTPEVVEEGTLEGSTPEGTQVNLEGTQAGSTVTLADGTVIQHN